MLANAELILEAAEASAQVHRSAGDWTIVVGSRGEIEMIAGREWGLEALRSERGAAMVFRVAQDCGRVAVEGRAPGRVCRVASETPAAVARRLLANCPAYRLASPVLPPAAI